MKVNDYKFEKIKKIVSPDVIYNKIKFKSDIYTTGDTILVRDLNEGFLVAKLTRIIQFNGFKKYPFWPTIEVQCSNLNYKYYERYYKKSDISREKNSLTDELIFNSISEYEIFESNHKDIIFIESIICSCKVYSYEEYEALAEHTHQTFFCRASYDPLKQTLNPAFDDWEKSCICKTPLNPDQLYIKCDSCEKWYHPKCCGIEEEVANELTEFFCIYCTKN